MPLTKGQAEALALLAVQRAPDSYVAGATPLHRDGGRFSADIDIFNDSDQRASEAANIGADTLAANGFSITWLRRTGGTHSLVAERNGEAVKLEWVSDSDYRFFPTVPDAVFGFTLHPIDLAANKLLAAGNRRELRDLIDVVKIHETILPIGPLAWAAVEKSAGYTPEGLVSEIRRNSHYPRELWETLRNDEPLDPETIMSKLRTALDDADTFFGQMPTEKIGRLFLDNGKVVQPDPAHLDRYVEHKGARRGHWPSNPDIANAMMQSFDLS